MRYWDEQRDELRAWPVVRDGAIALVAVVIGMIAGCPHYIVWQQGLAGEAELKRAQQNRQIAIAQANAKKEAAAALAEAEVTRAGGVAKANQIIGDSLRNNESYLRYLWITEISGDQRNPTVIYIPTEANLPILEASRHPR
jgi:hypothetical protein